MQEKTEAVLKFLQQKGDWVYGLDIVREMKLPSGSLDIHTHRLEKGGYVESKWVPKDRPADGSPRRRYYKATGKKVPAPTPRASMKMKPRFA